MNKFFKLLIYFLISLIVILGIGYLVVRNMPKASTKNVEAELTITAEDLHAQFSANEGKANKDFVGKVITVEGDLIDSFTDEQGNPAIILGNQETDLVFVTLYPSESEKLSKLPMEQNIKVKGTCTGMLSEVTINKAIVTE